jgi:hypothetical protein
MSRLSEIGQASARSSFRAIGVRVKPQVVSLRMFLLRLKLQVKGVPSVDGRGAVLET